MKKEKAPKVKKEKKPGRCKKVWAIIGIVLGVILVFAIGFLVANDGLEIKVGNAGGTSQKQEEQPTEANVEDVDNIPDDTTVAGEAVTDSSGETVTSAEGTPVTEVPVTAAVGTDPLKFSKAQIISYFNDSANKVRTNKPGFSRETVQQYSFKSEKLPDWLISFLDDIAAKEKEEKSETIKKGTDNADTFASQSKTWAAKLQPSDVRSATITKSGENYKVSIKLIDNEKNPQEDGKSAYSRYFDIDLPEEVIPQLEDVGIQTDLANLTVSYRGGYIDATIDKNGNIVDINYGLIADLIMTNPKIKGIKVSNLTVVTNWDGEYSKFVW